MTNLRVLIPEISDNQWKLLERAVLDCLPEEQTAVLSINAPTSKAYIDGFKMALSITTAAITNVFNGDKEQV